MFKVGDRVIVVGNEAMFGSSKEERNGVGVVSDLPDEYGYYGVTLDTGYYVAAKPENIHYYAEAPLKSTPPKKITHNGYEYELAEPVEPEWLVDGAWVVNVENGEKRLIKEERPGAFNLRVNDIVSIRYHDGIRHQYRPHTDKDYKWGDWAMYDGKKVFVMTEADSEGCVAISHPNIWGNDITKALDQLKHVRASTLTPTF